MASDDSAPRPSECASSLSAAAQGKLLAGRYELAEQLGAGGMGVVRRARDMLFNRDVAVKLLKPEVPADAPAATRFHFEATITGQLQHPGIPPAYELGTASNGQPFLAMKLVKGETLRDLLHQRQSAAEGLGRFIAIFEQVCHAVGYAHAQGVVHRDLKPSNVMVGAHGEVQVMDWGLAKRLQDAGSPNRRVNPDLLPSNDMDPDATLHWHGQVGTPEAGGSETRMGSVLGTPSYMAPEQAAGEIHKLDARTDVFGLGAMLCEILTGAPPYRGQDGNSVPLQAMSWETADAFARLDGCGAEPELVALCKRCLAFKQEDRPGDATAVAQQVAEIRQGAEARARQAELEQQQALVREVEGRKRRRVVQRAAAAIALVLLAGLCASLWQMRRALNAEALAKASAARAERNAQKARQAEKLARRHAAAALRERDAKAAALKAEEQARRLADKRRVEAEEARRQEERQRKYAEAIATFVKEDFFALTSVEGQERFGGEGLRRDTSLEELLDRAAAKLTQRKDLDPRIEAELCWIIGVNYRGAGGAKKGVPFLERAWELRREGLGADHEETLNAANSLAVCYQTAGRLEEALRLHEETLALRRNKLGPDHPDTLHSMSNLALAYQAAGRLEEALRLDEETLALRKTRLGPDHPDTLQSMNNLALAYQAAGRLEEALRLHEETLALRRTRLGPDHPDTLTSMNNLAFTYQSAGRLAEAVRLHEETLVLRKTRLGPDHPDTLTSINNLALAYRAAGRLERAVPLYEEALGLCHARLGPDHPHTLTSMNNLATAYRAAGRLDQALPLFDQAATGIEKRRFQHEHASRILANTIAAYEAAMQLEQAEAWRRKWAAHVKELIGSDSLPYAAELAALGLNLLQQKKWAEAETALRECLTIRQQQPEVWTTFHTQSMLGEALLGQEKYAKAEPLLVSAYEGLKARREQIPQPVRAQWLIKAVDRLIALYTALNRPDDAQAWQAEKARLTSEASLPSPP
ncbi:MAG: serine/threonine-protein kinase [Pirellulales bacterium]|nr:serine/threonine-protein kinase [Pirellulales bacterium]